MLKEDLINKPENIKNKIVSGRIDKRLKEISLLYQPFIRNPNISIEELIKQHIALLGENIKIRRFEKFILGEGLEKKFNNLNKDIENLLQK